VLRPLLLRGGLHRVPGLFRGSDLTKSPASGCDTAWAEAEPGAEAEP
jgi:hypothetical protein